MLLKKLIFPTFCTFIVFNQAYGMEFFGPEEECRIQTSATIPEVVSQKMMALVEASLHKSDIMTEQLALRYATQYTARNLLEDTESLQKKIDEMFLQVEVYPATLLSPKRAPSRLLMQLIRWGCARLACSVPNVYYCANKGPKPRLANVSLFAKITGSQEFFNQHLRSASTMLIERLMTQPTVFFRHDLDDEPYGIIKGIILTALQCCRQYQHEIGPENPNAYRGYKHEASVQVFRHCNCTICAQEFFEGMQLLLLSQEPGRDALTYDEALALINSLPPTLCAYHDQLRKYPPHAGYTLAVKELKESIAAGQLEP